MRNTLVVPLLVALLSGAVVAQEHKPSLSGCHALVGVTVLTEPGRRLEGATVVVRDGLIEAVGTDVTVPADAEVLKGDGLVVCAGFVVVGPAIGEAPTAPARKQPADVTSAPDDRERLGITPQRRVPDLLSGSEDPLPGKDWLAQGVTSVIVHPKGRLAPGTAAVVSTASGSGAERLVKDGTALVLRFAGGRGGYPGSLMGMVATHRQMFLDADRLRIWNDRFERDPRGIPSPPHSAELAAVIPALRGKVPALFECGRSGDVRRAMRLTEEFKLKPWVRGGGELGKAVDRIVGGNAVAVLDVTVPEAKYEANRKWLKEGPEPARPQARGDKPGEERPAAVKDTGDGEKPEPADEDPYVAEARRLRADKERERIEPLVTAGGGLASRGVPLVVGAAKPKGLMDHVRTQVRFGLDKDACHEALTQRPASLVGLDRALGKVRNGYRADIVVFDGDPFGDASVAHVFCRGERYDLPKKKAKGADGKKDATDGGAAKVVGKWTVSVEGRDEDTTLDLQKSASGVGGKYSFGRGDGDVTSVEVVGDKVTIVCEMSGGGFDVEITFDATLSKDGKTLEGEVSFGDFGSRPFKATKGGGQ